MSYISSDRATVMVVDDTPIHLGLFNQALKGSYRVKIANNGAKAIELALAAPPDLIILDVLMPGMDGFEVCKQLKNNPITADIPVILTTASANLADEQRGFDVGAVDYIYKPITFPTVLARVKTHLQIRAWQEFLHNQNTWLQQEVNRRVNQAFQLQIATIQVMVVLAEFRDEETSNHIRRTQEYVRHLGAWLVKNNRFGPELNLATVEQMALAAPLHDIGKISIPDHILLKPDRLTRAELAIMQTHTTKGYAILEQVRRDVGEDNPLLRFSSQITRHHHEHWDGSGYPDGLAGNGIPISARLMAIADVYDASRSTRPYKRPLTHEQSLESITLGRGSQFDPDGVDAFLAIEETIKEIATKLADP